MRTESEMMTLITSFARHDERVRVMAMEGSRVNSRAPKDRFQDYDITCVVTDIAPFTKDDAWLDRFGKRIIMQKPEAMSLFPATLGNWFTYLMLFEDGNRIDLKLVPLEELDKYLGSDSLMRILLDKDGRIASLPEPDDRDYLITPPSAEFFDDCCNEFWWVSTYVAKGLCRNEMLYALDHLNGYVRPSLLRMLAWQAAIEINAPVAAGKSYKYLPGFLSRGVRQMLQHTCRNGTPEEIRQALFDCHSLFRTASGFVAKTLAYSYPDYDEKVSAYIGSLLKN